MKRTSLGMSTMTALSAAGVLLLSACGGGSGGSSDGTVTLKLVAADYGSNGQNPSQAYWDNLVSAFEKDNPKIKVSVQIINWNDIDKQVATMVQAGNQPDILQTGGYASFAKDGLLYPAASVLDASTQADFISSLTQAGEVGGTQYGIPFVSSARQFLINNALWKKAGLPMNGSSAVAPKTWADVEKDAKALKAAGVEIPLGLPLGSEEAQGESFMWMMQNGGGYQDSSGKWAIDSPQNVATFTQLKAWVNEGLTEKDPAAVNRTDLYKDFASGKVGMLNGHPTQLGDIKTDNLSVTWAPLPSKDGTGNATLGVADWMMAFKKSGHQAQIKTFLDYVFTKQNTVKFDEEYNLMPVTKDALDQVKTDVPALVPFLNALPDAKLYPLNDPTWDSVSANVKTQIGSAVTGDPQSVLSTLQKQAQQAGQ